MQNKPLVALSLITLACGAAFAQGSPATVSAAADKAIRSNPEVAAKFNALRASAEEVDAAQAGYLPRVDLTAEAGRTEDRITGRDPANQSLNRTGVALNITQVLWDGFATRSEVSRVSHTRMARYFEFLDATEQAALEAARAHHDVLRYRRLVTLAEDNYVQHKYAFDQIQSRVRAGVARGVDLEQSGARLALAESNLVTEKANLHDVTERYRRIVGELPADAATPGQTFAQALPTTGVAALETTARRSPVIAGAVENLRAVRAQGEARRSPFQPRVEARLRSGEGRNFDGVENQKRDTSATIALTWNLFNGGADDARVRQQTHLLNQAADLRDKACRDVRQTAAIAYNDVRRLDEQLGYLDRNTIAIEKARDAYRQQFDIGQRSLLDLLNAENELYTAKRSYAMAVADRDIAIVRTHAAMGTLVAALGLARPDTDSVAPDGAQWAAGDDAATRCPLEPTELASMTRADLDAKARSMVGASGPQSMSPAPAPASAAAPAASMPVAPAAAPLVSAPSPTSAVEQRVRDWAAAWVAKDVTRYLSFYADSFATGAATHGGDRRAQWRAGRERALSRPGDISVQLNQLSARAVSPTRVEATFEQVYRSPTHRDTMRKTLVWELQAGQWRIVSESNR
ncbi:TolC family outer membrane protein [Ideonella sp. DXS29W]|uniref:TolC family outer membrane protein n=1 Tax=Ideonella lacteola TaxID=2984193 RepID=A0ABU9BY09_9BURK